MRLDPKDSREIGYYLGMAQAGIEMVVPIVAGSALDHYFDWSPWGTVIGAVLGFTLGLTHLIVMANRSERREAKDEGRETRGEE